MDPISLTLGVVGLGMSIFGGISGAQSSSFYAQQSRQYASAEYGVENQESALREQMAHTQNSRAQLENLRTTQRARANAVQAGVTDNAQFGSGVAGGKAEVTNEGAFNALGLSQGLMATDQMYGLNQQFNTLQYQRALMGANAQQAQSTAQGWQSLGGAVMRSGPMVGNMFGGGSSKGFGNFNFLFGGGSPSGYGNS